MSSNTLDGLQSFTERHDYHSWLDLQLDNVDHGKVQISIPANENLHNPGRNGLIHGGIAATLIDTASGFALRTTFEDPVTARLATTDLNVSYLRPATGTLIAEAKVLRAGETTGVTDVSVKSTDEDESVAAGRTTY
ncbi:PaaI family thioesterase [Halalkalicoccus jeotgali]|uniref:Thioesterase superfamily protein n=1 Tax=Halalkalicoccus jeotgali (strain DSM 18796 / CECT 7217 / JCM 14584 / KCTC 4019 / B3) TaxID=795797 RepID=D8JBF7_HALJB|nr:PaaI family thioesterase [Halalkalicoccus jeotgali]ADJ16610.1 thioesterase superfamily protein [Halalkalicoccus jeotgali B3]ELY41293.1 thioesterase superfamily protein [Halalkalicoccus jeotgali B3]